jgi:hypothetical protein
MCRIAAEQASNADDGVVFTGQGQFARRRWDLKRTRHADNDDVFLGRAGANQSIARTQEQPFGNERIEARDDDSEPFVSGIEPALKSLNRGFRRGLQLQFAFLLRNVSVLGGKKISKILSS